MSQSPINQTFNGNQFLFSFFKRILKFRLDLSLGHTDSLVVVWPQQLPCGLNCSTACENLAPQTGIKPESLLNARWILNHWTTREVPDSLFWSCYSEGTCVRFSISYFHSFHIEILYRYGWYRYRYRKAILLSLVKIQPENWNLLKTQNNTRVCVPNKCTQKKSFFYLLLLNFLFTVFLYNQLEDMIEENILATTAIFKYFSYP